MPQMSKGFSSVQGNKPRPLVGPPPHEDGLFPPHLIPSGEQPVNNLERIFPCRSLETFLLDSHRPEVTQVDILKPEGYQQAVRDAAYELRRISSTTRISRIRTHLDAAAAILDEHLDLMEALTISRNLLFKG